jgi:hypothetical protein
MKALLHAILPALVATLFIAAIAALASPALAETEGPFFQDPRSRPAISYQWATPVHDLMIDTAFFDADWRCVVRLKEGSREADSLKYQTGDYSHMHAMRKKGEDPAQAAQRMWRYVEDKYAEVRLLARDGRMEDACFLRGMALHPIMDSTSPVHREFTQWDPVAWKDLLKPTALVGKLLRMAQHGDLQKYLDRLVALPTQLSEEDLAAIDDHPEFLLITADLMLAVDRVEMLD